MLMQSDEYYMAVSIERAREAQRFGKRPFGNVIVNPRGAVIGIGSGSETPLDPTRHSELEAIRMACITQDGLLQGCTLYSTHEPCLMCTGAILHAKLSRVVWGSSRTDLPSLFRELDVGDARWLDTNHPPEIKSGVLRHQCIELFEEELLVLAAEKPVEYDEPEYDPEIDVCPECDVAPGEQCPIGLALLTGFGEHGEHIPDCPRDRRPLPGGQAGIAADPDRQWGDPA